MTDVQRGKLCVGGIDIVVKFQLYERLSDEGNPTAWIKPNDPAAGVMLEMIHICGNTPRQPSEWLVEKEVHIEADNGVVYNLVKSRHVTLPRTPEGTTIMDGVELVQSRRITVGKHLLELVYAAPANEYNISKVFVFGKMVAELHSAKATLLVGDIRTGMATWFRLIGVDALQSIDVSRFSIEEDE